MVSFSHQCFFPSLYKINEKYPWVRIKRKEGRKRKEGTGNSDTEGGMHVTGLRIPSPRGGGG